MMIKKDKTPTRQTLFVVFLYCTLGQEDCLHVYGTIPIDTDNVRIDMSENL
jgi:hypothetical protein